MINQCRTKFEVSIGSPVMKLWMAVQNAENEVGLGQLGGTQGHGQCIATIRLNAYDFLFDFNRNYVSIFYRFRDIASYRICRKSPIWPTPPAFGVPIRVAPVKYRGDLWSQKTRAIVWCCLCDPIRVAVLVEHRLVTYGHRPMSSSTADAYSIAR